jgi:hypothetical protein
LPIYYEPTAKKRASKGRDEGRGEMDAFSFVAMIIPELHFIFTIGSAKAKRGETPDSQRLPIYCEPNNERNEHPD